MNLFTKQKQTYKLMVTTGETWGGINQDFGINIHTTIYKKYNQ